jgi:hypothetical protein
MSSPVISMMILLPWEFISCSGDIAVQVSLVVWLESCLSLPIFQQSSQLYFYSDPGHFVYTVPPQSGL